MDGTQWGHMSDKPMSAAMSPRVLQSIPVDEHGSEQVSDWKSDGFRSDAVGISGVSGKNGPVAELDVADEGQL